MNERTKAFLLELRRILQDTGDSLISPTVRDTLCKLIGDHIATAPASDVPPTEYLYCPNCGCLHVDGGAFASRPHHVHRCAKCLRKWDVGHHSFGISGQSLALIGAPNTNITGVFAECQKTPLDVRSWLQTVCLELATADAEYVAAERQDRAAWPDRDLNFAPGMRISNRDALRNAHERLESARADFAKFRSEYLVKL